MSLFKKFQKSLNIDYQYEKLNNNDFYNMFLSQLISKNDSITTNAIIMFQEKLVNHILSSLLEKNVLIDYAKRGFSNIKIFSGGNIDISYDNILKNREYFMKIRKNDFSKHKIFKNVNEWTKDNMVISIFNKELYKNFTKLKDYETMGFEDYSKIINISDKLKSCFDNLCFTIDEYINFFVFMSFFGEKGEQFIKISNHNILTNISYKSDKYLEFEAEFSKIKFNLKSLDECLEKTIRTNSKYSMLKGFNIRKNIDFEEDENYYYINLNIYLNSDDKDNDCLDIKNNEEFLYNKFNMLGLF